MRKLLKRIANFARENYPVQMNGLIAEIEVELNKPDPEPVAWTFPKRLELLASRGTFTSTTLFSEQDDGLVPLYTHPPGQEPEPEPLTDTEIEACMLASCDLQSYEDVDWGWTNKKVLNELKFARAIEQKVWSKMK